MRFLQKRVFLFFLVFTQMLGVNGGILLAQAPGGGSNVMIGSPSTEVGGPSTNGKSFGSEGRSRSTVLLGSPGLPGGQIFQEQSLSVLSYQVHILGEVTNPGTFRISASTRLYEALRNAGGVSAQGSERRIELRRKGSGGRRVDLFWFRKLGKLDDNPYLLDNDVIFVPLRDKVAQIEGAVKNPGVYELLNEKTLADLISLAGGFTPGVAKSNPIKIIRISSGEKQMLDMENTDTERLAFNIQKGDVVVVPHSLTVNKKFDYTVLSYPGDNGLFYPTTEERVFVLGAVRSPGPISFNPNYNIRQYLTLSGGTTKLAKTRSVKVISADGRAVRASQNLGINPGDSIVVPERYLAPESILSLVLGLTTSVLGITTTVLTLTR